MKRVNAHILIGVCLLALAAGDAYGTPDPGKWRQQALIGANETYFFYYETVRIYPGSYYGYSEQLSLCRKRRADNIVDEKILLRNVQYAANAETMVWTSSDADTTLAFDLSRYLRENRVCLAIHGRIRDLPAFGKGGIYIGEESKKAIIVPMISIYSQAPLMNEDPRVVASWTTAEPWRTTTPGEDSKRTVYYLVQSGYPSLDAEYAEDIVFVER